MSELISYCLCFVFTGIIFRGMLHHVCDVDYDENICGLMRTRNSKNIIETLSIVSTEKSELTFFLILYFYAQCYLSFKHPPNNSSYQCKCRKSKFCFTIYKTRISQGEERLNALLLVHIHQDIFLHYNKIIKSQEITQSGNLRAAIAYVIAKRLCQCLQTPQSAQFFLKKSAVHYLYHLK